MQTTRGTMATDRPERYAKQLASHWAKRGPVTEEGGATVMRWDSGQVIVMRPVEGALYVEVSVPDDADLTPAALTLPAGVPRMRGCFASHINPGWSAWRESGDDGNESFQLRTSSIRNRPLYIA